MKRNKILSLILAVAVLAAAAAGAVMTFAVSPVPPIHEFTEEEMQSLNTSQEQDEPDENGSYFMAVTGTVVEMLSFTPAYGSDAGAMQTIVIETGEYEGAVAHLNLMEGTVFPFDGIEDIEEGDTVTGFFIAGAPMAMIYPPQYTVRVLVSGAEAGQNVQVDRFTLWENDSFPLLAYGGLFAFAIVENTEVILADGSPFLGEFEDEGHTWTNTIEDLDHRRMVVIYDVSTRSLPEFTTANKVIVMFEDAVHLPGELDLDDILDVSVMPIVVEGEYISAPAAFMADDEITVMVPLRAIAEALGFDVTWNTQERAIELSGVPMAFTWLQIGNTEVEFAGHYMLELPVAPVIVDGHTYVPLVSFFRDILGGTAFVFEGRIEVFAEGGLME